MYVDLDSPAPDGEVGEGDILIGVGSVATGRGNDRLAGTAAPETLDGGPGADVITGRGGNDRISASGPDLVSSGAGNDFVLSPQGAPSIRCGPGKDAVEADARGAGAWLARDCEQLYSPTTGQGDDPTETFAPPRPVRASSSGRLVFRLPCILRHCRERLTLTRPEPPFKVLVSRRVRIPEGFRPIPITLPAKVAARARRTALRLRVHLVTAKANYGTDLVSGWRFDLRLPTR